MTFQPSRRSRFMKALWAALLLPAPVWTQVQVPVEMGPGGVIAPAPTPLSAAPRTSTIPGRYYVTFREGTAPAERARAAMQIGAAVVHNFAYSSAMVIIVPNDSLLQGLQSSNSVLEIVPDQIIEFAAPPPPPAPESLSASVSGADVTLTWTQKKNVSSFTLERCVGSGCGDFAPIATNIPTDPKVYVDADLAVGTYRYRMFAVNNSGSSPPSNVAEAPVAGGGSPPPSPALTSAIPSGSDIDLAWTDVAGETSYRVQRCMGSGCNNFVDHSPGLPADTTAYTDSGLADGTYGYRVVASNSNGDSPPSNSLEATVETAPPPPPPPPSDPLIRGTQELLTYAVQRVGRPVSGSTGAGVGIAVIDSGFDFNHSDLAPAPDVPGAVISTNPPDATGTSFNAGAPGSSCQDVFSHGTHVAGLMAAIEGNNEGMIGVAPEATLYCVKIDEAADPGLIPLSNVQAGLEWVLASHDRVTPNIKVVNLSLTAADGNTAVHTAISNLIQDLRAVGVATVASAGNDPTMDVDDVFPANVANVISAAGTTATDGLNTCISSVDWVLADTVYAGGNGNPGTTDGPGVTISAPAEERHDLLPNGFGGCTAFLYGTLSTSLTTTGPAGVTDLITRKLPTPGGPFEARGTSFSAALISGAVARIYQAELEGGTLTGTSADVTTVVNALVSNADRAGAVPLDHPWVGAIPSFVYDFDGVREGIGQAPMPVPAP